MPAAPSDSEREGEAPEAPAAPSEAARAAITAHLRHAHGLTSARERRKLERSYDSVRGVVSCPRCPGAAIVVEHEPHPELLRLLAHQPTLAPLLSGLTEPERRVILEGILSGALGRTQALQLERRARLAGRPARPEVARRKRQSQAFLLAAYKRHGTVEKALDALVSLHRDDRGRYRELMGTDRLFAYETLRGYWRGIPLEQRHGAKENFKAGNARGQEHRDTGPLVRKDASHRAG